MKAETLIVELACLEDTMRLGQSLGRLAMPGDVIALAGDLGAGKTALTQAIGQGLAVPETCYITSPTFNLIHEYPGRIPLYHMDLYRLVTEEEIELLGLEDYLYGDGLSVIEWADRLGRLLPDEYLHLTLHMVSPSARTAILNCHGQQWLNKLKQLEKSLHE